MMLGRLTATICGGCKTAQPRSTCITRLRRARTIPTSGIERSFANNVNYESNKKSRGGRHSNHNAKERAIWRKMDTEQGSRHSLADPMDDVYGAYEFDASDLRQSKPELVDPSAFAEVKPPNLAQLSLNEKKYQALDPHDYLLQGDYFVPVDPQRYLIPSTAEAPDQHRDLSNVGKFFPLSKLSEGFAKSMQQELDANDEQYIMLREPGIRIASQLQAFADGDYTNGPDPVILLGGKRNTGKSTTLAHVVDYARNNGWLTLFIPQMHGLLNDSWMMEPSLRRPGFFDQPDFAVQLLSNFASANEGLLENIKLKTRDDPATEGRLEHFETLADLVGTHSNDDAGIDHVGLVLDLHRELAEVTELPVLVALDDYNHCYQTTGYFYDGIPIEAEQLTLVHALQYFQPRTNTADDGESNDIVFAPTSPLRNGVVVVAEAHHRPLSRKKQKPFRKFWRSVADCSSRVTVKRYSVPELESCMRHYYQNRLSFQPPTESAINTLHLLTDGNPAEVLLTAANQLNFLTHVHLPRGQRGRRQNQWKHER